MKNINKLSLLVLLLVVLTIGTITASSHREAPLISNDPLADNVDVYAFVSPDDPTKVTLIATYIPFQLPHGGPNYYNFGENIRYEIHVDNDASIPGDEITYRFTFDIVNEDPTTFFNIRLGAQNQKATYTLERSLDGGQTFETIVQNGVVPPNNIGERSIEGAAGLNTSYSSLWNNSVMNASTGESVFAGPSDDPFFVDLGGIFDLGDAPRQNGTPVDGVACYNVSTLAIQVPISTLLKDGAPDTPANILDPNYVIGVWASASRPAITTITSDEGPTYAGDWVQVSRLGMPLTNEAVIPIGFKDIWNAMSPYEEIADTTMDQFFYNPELALYMDDDLFGGAVPAFSPLRIQTNSLGMFDFTNGADGVSALKDGDLTGTAFENFGDLLLIPGNPRSVDLWPIFHTGVPNAIPYQLATGKEGNPVAAGKPFINNFLPNGGDMLRLNMAVPPTPRDDENFSSLGLVQAAAIGLTVPPFNTTADLEFIPNMDGFPNGRRLEDDVTRIELQAVGGVVLAAIGLWYDDYDPETSPSPVTDQLLNVLTYTTGVEENDKSFRSSFPYVAMPFSGKGDCSGEVVQTPDLVTIDRFYSSSNTESNIGIYNIKEDNSIVPVTVGSQALDADGIHFEWRTGLLYELDRTNNSINVYSNIENAAENGEDLAFEGSSSSDFINGREIAVLGNKLVVTQDANDDNGMENKLYVYNISGTDLTLEKEFTTTFNLWGIHLEQNALYAIMDNTNKVAVINDFFSKPVGSLSPDNEVSIEALVRTHGITYDSENDVMILTDVGDAGSATDGAIFIVEDFTNASSDGIVEEMESSVISGEDTSLGNPVDIALDETTRNIFVAERANSGGLILGFKLSDTGNESPFFNFERPGASAIFFDNMKEAPDLMTIDRYYASSNTEAIVNIYNVKEDQSIVPVSVASQAMDADGIHYEWTTGLLYELDRTNNVINVYSNVENAAENGEALTFEGSSTSDFINGREIAVIDDRLIVAQDANDANGMENKLLVYRIDGINLTLDKEHTTSFNLWGIHVEEDALYAIMDNTNKVAVLSNFFAKPEGPLTPDVEVSVEGLVRTHGITYDKNNDMMLLTDVGDAGSATDGAIFIIPDFINASSDNLISNSEARVISGDQTSLGNPVDIALDESTSTIYVAERANSGGLILGFRMTDDGNSTPFYSRENAGASAIFFDNEKTGSVSVKDEEIEYISSVVYPNPTNNSIKVLLSSRFLTTENLTYTLRGVNGQALENGLLNNSGNINVSELSPGLYFITVQQGNLIQTSKFTKL